MEPDCQDLEELEKFTCMGCFGEWYCPQGIDPSFCPFCGRQLAIGDAPPGADWGYWDEMN